MPTRTSKIPWGLLLLAAGGYLWYKHHQTTTPTPAPAAAADTSGPSTSLPPTTVTTATVTNPTQLSLPPAPSSARAIVLQQAQAVGTPAWLAFAQNGTDADIATMANIITSEWQVYGRCHTDTCSQQWQAIYLKYGLA